MAGYVGIDPSALAAVAGLLDDAALELRGCAALVDLDDDTGERVKVSAVAEWAENAAHDLRKRAAADQTYELLRGPRAPWPWGGSQHGNNNKKISAEERARLEALIADPTTSKKERAAAQRKVDADKKARHEKQSSLSHEDKTPKQQRVVDPKDLEKPAEYAAAGATSGMLLWWLGKLASPLCGPAVVACAVIA
jgi:hypothetical protein